MEPGINISFDLNLEGLDNLDVSAGSHWVFKNYFML